MNIRNIDLNLLVYLNVLLEEGNVSKAANKLALTQPAMSNALNRLRELFDDPLLVRTKEGMTPTDKANKLKPEILTLLNMAEKITQPDKDFSPDHSKITFRIMANDYIEATLLSPFINSILPHAPNINFDILTPADISLQDMEKGTIDLAINRFTMLPKSFHQLSVWRDNYCCLVNKNHPYVRHTDLDTYLDSDHLWVDRASWGPSTVVTNQSSAQKLGWVDEALWQLEKTRNIRVFSRHFMISHRFLNNAQLIATIPRRHAMLHEADHELTIMRVPFQIVPIEIKMIWSPLLHHSRAHQWLRRSISDYAKTISDR